jgi:hypothetical protein
MFLRQNIQKQKCFKMAFFFQIIETHKGIWKHINNDDLKNLEVQVVTTFKYIKWSGFMYKISLVSITVVTVDTMFCLLV